MQRWSRERSLDWFSPVRRRPARSLPGVSDRPAIILALQLGGNNPIIARGRKPFAAASIVAPSAFVMTGQRCSCARRLIDPEGAGNDAMVAAVDAFAARFCIGAWDEDPEPAIGPLIFAAAGRTMFGLAASLVSLNAEPLRRYAEQARAGVPNWTGRLPMPPARCRSAGPVRQATTAPAPITPPITAPIRLQASKRRSRTRAANYRLPPA